MMPTTLLMNVFTAIAPVITLVLALMLPTMLAPVLISMLTPMLTTLVVPVTWRWRVYMPMNNYRWAGIVVMIMPCARCVVITMPVVPVYAVAVIMAIAVVAQCIADIAGSKWR